MGADQHLDPEDRAEIAVVAYELYREHGSLRKVREHLSTHPTVIRLLGARRLFAADTIRTFLDEGRTAERYVDLLKLQDQRADSDMRLSMLGSLVHEWMKLHPGELRDVDGFMKLIMGLLKIEQTRIGLGGWAAPTRVTHSLDESEPALPPADMVRAIAAARAADEMRRQQVIENDYPGANVLPARRSSRQARQRPDDDRRTS